MIQLHDKKFEVFISGAEINFAIENMAKQIEDDFFDDVPVFIGVLNGSFMVVSDLLKKYNQPCEVSFVKMASYEGTQTTNEVKQLIGVNQNLEGRSVIIVEDIVDTGLTAHQIWPDLQAQKPASLALMTLLLKPDALQMPVECSYVGFSIPNRFVVGYGLDFDQQGREWNDIYVTD